MRIRLARRPRRQDTSGVQRERVGHIPPVQVPICKTRPAIHDNRRRGSLDVSGEPRRGFLIDVRHVLARECRGREQPIANAGRDSCKLTVAARLGCGRAPSLVVMPLLCGWKQLRANRGSERPEYRWRGENGPIANAGRDSRKSGCDSAAHLGCRCASALAVMSAAVRIEVAACGSRWLRADRGGCVRIGNVRTWSTGDGRH